MNASTHPESSPGQFDSLSPRPTASKHRWWMPALVLLLLAGALVSLRLLPDDSLDPGLINLFSMIGTTAGSLLVLLWFAFFSGWPARVRGGGIVAVLALAGVAVGSIRRLEFTGGMVPEFDWRWTRSREAVLDDYLAKQTPPPAEPVASTLPAATPEDMPEYRGPARDGVVHGPPLLRDWQASPPREVWRHPVGGGYAALAVQGPLAVTIEQRRGEEAVVAYDVATGQERWQHAYPALFSEQLGGDGPRATPTIARGKVYSLGATGVLVCLDAATGKSCWSQNILEANRVENLQWGMSGSPLVIDGLVIVNPGSQKGGADSHSLLALDAETGERRWAAGTSAAAYASPMLATLAGRRQVVIFDAFGLAGYDPADGEQLWQAQWDTPFKNSAAQPVVLPGDRLYFSTDQGGGVVQIKANGEKLEAAMAWTNNQMKCAYSNPVYHDGHIYGLDEGILVCQNIDDGRRAWKARRGRYGHGQILLAGDLLVILTEQGELALVEATPEEFRELGKIQALDGKTWNNPVLVHGRALIRNHLEMACYDLALAESATSETAGEADEAAKPDQASKPVEAPASEEQPADDAPAATDGNPSN